MKTLFDVLDGIIESGYAQENLASADHVINYGEAVNICISSDQAESIIRVGQHWLDQRQNGNGEWSRMRDEAKDALTCYIQIYSREVATVEVLKHQFESMRLKEWFGKSEEECENLHWLNDCNELIEVEWDTEYQGWVEKK